MTWPFGQKAASRGLVLPFADHGNRSCTHAQTRTTRLAEPACNTNGCQHVRYLHANIPTHKFITVWPTTKHQERYFWIACRYTPRCLLVCHSFDGQDRRIPSCLPAEILCVKTRVNMGVPHTHIHIHTHFWLVRSTCTALKTGRDFSWGDA